MYLFQEKTFIDFKINFLIVKLNQKLSQIKIKVF